MRPEDIHEIGTDGPLSTSPLDDPTYVLLLPAAALLHEEIASPQDSGGNEL